MRLKPTIKGIKNLEKEVKQEVVTTKKERKSSTNSLPPNEYKPEFEPIRFLVKETTSSQDASKRVKQHIELSVKRYGEFGLPHVFVQVYQESDFYTGYLKGKSVNFPLEMMQDFMDNMSIIDEECDKRGIE